MSDCRFDAVLFDCDGVLVDSEPITCAVLARMLGELGWTLTLRETMDIFVGKMVKDEAALIQARTGFAIDEDWLAGFRARRDEALAREVAAIPGALAAVEAVHADYAGRIALASGADRVKLNLQLGRTGLLSWFEGRIFSGHEMPRSKPHPDVYLAAAAALDADPRRCAVIEDTVTGAAAGVAAGATVFGYSPGGVGHSSARALLDAGVSALFSDMRELPGLLRASAANGRG